MYRVSIIIDYRLSIIIIKYLVPNIEYRDPNHMSLYSPHLLNGPPPTYRPQTYHNIKICSATHSNITTPYAPTPFWQWNGSYLQSLPLQSPHPHQMNREQT